MANFLQEKLEKFKQLQQNAKNRKYTRKDAAVGVSMALVMTAMFGVMSFNPGVINYPLSKDSEKKVSIAEFSKLAGPQQTVEMEEKNPLRRSIQKKKVQTEKVEKTAETTTPFSTGFPSPFSGIPGMGGGSGSTQKVVAENVKATYARHVELTDSMKAFLNENFALKNMSKAPVGNESRFTSSFEYANGEGTVLERFELMSIVRTDRMKDIKTAQQALDSLVEESQAIRVIESTDEYLVYDFAGSGGYQIGKIAVDDKGIYIFGYVNLTTSEMPDVLKTEWINRYKTSL